MRELIGTVFLALFTATICRCSPTEKTPETIPEGTSLALVLTTDFQTGSYAVVSPEDLSVASNMGLIHDDSICRFDPLTGTPFVVARLGADAIEVIDPASGWSIANEYSVTPSSNPQDITVVSPERAFVTRLGDPSLLIVHPTDGTIIDTVDLSSWADADGNPDASWSILAENTLFVTLQKLDNFHPTGPSSILAIDPMTGVVEEEITLGGANVYGKLRYNETLGKLVLIESGLYGENDGGIELLDPVTGELSGFIVTEESLGGDLSDAVIASETLGYAVVGVAFGDGVHNRLVSFDPSTGEKIADLIVHDAWTLGFIELSPDNTQLWVSDRTPEAPGIRIFSTVDDTEITTATVSVGLPPFMICFVNSEDDLQPEGDAGVDSGADGGVDGGSDDGWLADEVVEAPGDTGEGTGDATHSIDGVHGGGEGSANTSDVFSIGYNEGTDNYIVLSWSGRTVLNGTGTDFVVFENSFLIGAGPDCFMDQVVVQLSRDGINWVSFPHDYTAEDETEYSSDPSMWQGFAGIRPVLYNEDSNPVDPFDPLLSGGDHFDLDDLPGDTESEAIKEEGFRYLKLITAPTLFNPDTGDYYVSDPISNGADIDGVMARYFSYLS